MKCPFCGNKIDDNSINCMFCGMKLPRPGEELQPIPEPSVRIEPEPEPLQPESVSYDPAPAAQPASDPEPEPAAPKPSPVFPSAVIYRPAPVSSAPKEPEPPAYDPPLSVGAYLGIVFLSIIPVVGLIVLLIWGCSARVNTNRRNLSIVLLLFKLVALFFVIGVGAAVLLFGIPYVDLPW